jgi:hypothetical protein
MSNEQPTISANALQVVLVLAFFNAAVKTPFSS